MGNHPEMDWPKTIEYGWDEMYACNNWWRVRPGFIPDKLFQIHEGYDYSRKDLHPGWQEWYPQVKEIVTAQDYGWPNQRVVALDSAYWSAHPKAFYQSSFGYMFAEAFKHDFEVIVMAGCRLDNTEYERQLSSVIMNLDETRRRGIELHCHWEPKFRREGERVDWGKVKEIDVMYGCRRWSKPIEMVV